MDTSAYGFGRCTTGWRSCAIDERGDRGSAVCVSSQLPPHLSVATSRSRAYSLPGVGPTRRCEQQSKRQARQNAADECGQMCSAIQRGVASRLPFAADVRSFIHHQ